MRPGDPLRHARFQFSARYWWQACILRALVALDWVRVCSGGAYRLMSPRPPRGWASRWEADRDLVILHPVGVGWLLALARLDNLTHNRFSYQIGALAMTDPRGYFADGRLDWRVWRWPARRRARRWPKFSEIKRRGRPHIDADAVYWDVHLLDP